MMNKYLIILIVALVSSCFKPEVNDKFEANFDIKGLESDVAYLHVFGDSDSTVIDSFRDGKISIAKGKFRLTGRAKEDVMIRISFTDGHLRKSVGRGYIPVKSASLWFILGPGKKLNITGDLTNKDFVDIYAKGDKENDKLALLNERIMPLLNVSANLSVKASQPGLSQEEIEKIKAEYDELENNDIQAARTDFVTSNPSSIAGLWLMEDMLIRSQIDPISLDPLLNKVDTIYYSSYFYKSVRSRVDGAKQVVVGSLCPNIEGTEANGEAFNIQQLRGKYVIIDFWGTWCGACLAGTPKMKEYFDKYSGRLEILGIAQDRNADVWRKCIDSNEMTWHHLLNGNGDANFVTRMNVQGFPTKIIIDPQGKIIGRYTGEGDDFYTELDSILSK